MFLPDEFLNCRVQNYLRFNNFLRYNTSIVAISKKTKPERNVCEITCDVSEITYDTSANRPETLAKPPKPLANWSFAKRLLNDSVSQSKYMICLILPMGAASDVITCITTPHKTK